MQENLNTKLAKIESLLGEIKRLTRDIDSLKDDKEREDKTIATLHHRIADLEEDNYDLEKKLDELKEEVSRLEDLNFDLRRGRRDNKPGESQDSLKEQQTKQRMEGSSEELKSRKPKDPK